MKLNIETLFKIAINSKENYYFTSLIETDQFIKSRNLNPSAISTCLGLKCETLGQVYYYPVSLEADTFKKTTSEQVRKQYVEHSTYSFEYQYTFDANLISKEPNNYYSVSDSVYQYHSYDPAKHCIAEENEVKQPHPSSVDFLYSTPKILYIGTDYVQFCQVNREQKLFLGDNPAQLQSVLDQRYNDSLGLFNRKKLKLHQLEDKVRLLNKELNVVEESLNIKKSTM